MAEDVDTGLRKNMEIFTRKFLAQQAQLEALEHTIVRQSNRVVSRVSAEFRKGPHDRVQDPVAFLSLFARQPMLTSIRKQIKALWKEMVCSYSPVFVPN
jgi:hypothetical protein